MQLTAQASESQAYMAGMLELPDQAYEKKIAPHS